MWIVKLALSRPYTFLVAALLILILSPIVILGTPGTSGMPVDIFPNINIPVVSILWNYTGFSPQQMEQRIVSPAERSLTTTVNDIEHTESQSLNGIGVIKVFFHPSVKIDMAVAQITAISQTQLRQLPLGTTPPLIIQYSASSVPIIQLSLSSRTLSEQALNDISLNVIRPPLTNIQGLASPYPYGGKQRQIQVDIDIPKLQALGLVPSDVVNAISAQNLILPSGTAKIGPLEYDISMNGSPEAVEELNNLPIRTVNGTIIYIRDVAHVRDGFAPQTNIVRQDGIRSTLISILKNGDVSTLDIVANVKALIPKLKPGLPDDLDIRTLFDQSLFVRASIDGVIGEGIIAACLTALMILLFLGDWKSTMIIAVSIPLSVLSSVLMLSILGETINIMTLGGLALAVGILVDDATVTIENIDRYLEKEPDLHEAILKGASQIAVPAFVSTLCICIVFVPMFLLSGVARYLFVPLAESVVFAVMASYILSRTLVPTLAMYLLKSHSHDNADPAATGLQPGEGSGKKLGFFGRFQQTFEAGFHRVREGYGDLLGRALEHRGLFAIIFLGLCLGSMCLVPFLGRDFFPTVDAGEFKLHIRAKTGTRIEETAKLCDQIEAVIRKDIPAKELGGILDNLGLPYSSINLSYSNSGVIGTADGDILVSLNPGHKPTADYQRQLRIDLPRKFPGTQFFFQPSDIVNQILNFGLSAPIDIQLIGRNVAGNLALAHKIADQLQQVPGAVDVHVHQVYDEPRFNVTMERSQAEQLGITANNIATTVLNALSGSFQTSPAFWLDPKNGVSYNVVVQAPQYNISSLQDLENLPVHGANSSQILANLATISRNSEPGTVYHYGVVPVVDVYASVQDRDLGTVSQAVNTIVANAQNEAPKATQLGVRGQVQTMNASFQGLGQGLIGAIVLVYLLMVVNFQSWTEPFIIITALPGALAGIVWMLFLTRTTLSVPALMGAIMCIGVATANSILVITFARERMAELKNAHQAVLEAGTTRLRPVIMTALAMIIGMIPMSLGLGEGGEQNAPLGRAVIGGLIVATVATLFFVPVVYSLIRGRSDQEQPESQPGEDTQIPAHQLK
ncbi:MAG TPA: efflux RND transporter permease subunit [Candidatus Methylacidiphilales bacterium]|jgi:multidrug efflux pump subunit AcrB|nr:efflux RND transporter permease subunit [Candidatus Methylacidiphilales bacterium]